MTESPVNAFRRKRFRRFLALLDRRPISILDVSGTAAYWKSLGILHGSDGVQITIVNMEDGAPAERNLRLVQGDACDLSEFSDDSFDFVHSKSVIEHVGRSSQMMHWLPEQARIRLLMNFGKMPKHIGRATPAVRRISLVSRAQPAAPFPGAEIWTERWIGLPKSLLAIRRSRIHAECGAEID